MISTDLIVLILMADTGLPSLMGRTPTPAFDGGRRQVLCRAALEGLQEKDAQLDSEDALRPNARPGHVRARHGLRAILPPQVFPR